jgi:hypothetical protein
MLNIVLQAALAIIFCVFDLWSLNIILYNIKCNILVNCVEICGSVAAVGEWALWVSVCTYTSIEQKNIENYCYLSNVSVYRENH